MEHTVRRTTQKVQQFITLLVLLSLLTLPFASAVQISNVRAEDISSGGARILWETDEVSNSFVQYGTVKAALQTVGDAKQTQDHQLAIKELAPGTTYYYAVQSADTLDNNSGNFYSFSTLPPDTTAPDINVDLPTLIPGVRLTFTGITEVGADVKVLVNGVLVSGQITTNKSFTFTDVLLTQNVENNVTLTATDPAGNVAETSGIVLADAQRPRIELPVIPPLVGDNLFTLQAPLSEESSYQIFVNNKSVAQDDEVNQIDEKINLEEGKNLVRIVIEDKAGWQTEEEFSIISDTQPPFVKAEIVRGHEYYEGRAESSIAGETEPSTKLYLYVYKPLGYEFTPQFDRPRAVVTADESGQFTFEDVNFAGSISDISLETITPKEIPSNLQKVKIFPTQEVAEQQQFSYFVYIIAEDSSGKTASWEQVVTVHTCFSGDLDFTVESQPEFQFPLRLVPQLMDDGRQEIQAVFTLQYNGEGLQTLDAQGNVIDKGFQVNSIRIDEACTQSMQEDEKFGLGCKILPRSVKTIPNADQTAVYATWKLLSSEELSDRGADFWDDFSKRQVMFPLKITVNFQERTGTTAQGTPQYGKQKFQTSCYDLGYFVDIPIESEELIPDFLANEGVDALNETISAINTVTPYIEQAYLITAWVGMASFGLRTIARWVRIFTSKVEYYFSTLKPKQQGEEAEDLNCPLNQFDLYLDETLENWQTLDPAVVPKKVAEAIAAGSLAEVSLDERCPRTADAWRFEAWMDQAYRWSWDRAFCREVPARWTADEKTEDIGAVILEQQQCAVTGRGVPLRRRENCQELIKQNPVSLPALIKKEDVSVCWQAADGTLYHYLPPAQGTDEAEDTKRGVYRLTPIGSLTGELRPVEDRLIAYKPEGAQDYFVGRDESCSAICNNRRKPGYSADTAQGDSNGCYTEKVIDGTITLVDKAGNKLAKDRYAAGYTRECFIDREAGGPFGEIARDPTTKEPILQQCVCTGPPEEQQAYQNEQLTLRTAIPEDSEKGVVEEWSYRQDRVFKESQKTSGTYYPDIRYYGGRDLSGAFGANHVFDMFRAEGEEKIPSVNPHTQIVGRYQSVCLSGILKDLRMLESILTGLRNCLVEAKYTGLQDAGMCKTLFTQHVCGLGYKLISLATNSCSPNNFDDVGKAGVFGDAGVVISEGAGALTSAVQTSIDDVQDEYGNAKLNEYFKGGTQGLAQSMCLAAFGLEFPLASEEFLLDAAYSFPMKTSALIAPAFRELSSYDPAQQTAIYNYEIGSVLFPGCKIKRWSVNLKCIGPEDLGNPNVDTSCGGQGCDCLNVQRSGAAYEGERVRNIASNFNLQSGQMFSVPIESPLHIASHYRYDHAVVELELDPSEYGNADSCFDEGYAQGNKGVFYFPIKDVSPTTQVSCQANAVTGRYECPQLASLFGFGGAYLEEPYVSCWNKQTETWIDCTTPNLFTIGDEIKVRVHVNTDGEGQCLRRTIQPEVPGLRNTFIRPIVENAPGQLFITENLGAVREEMFGGSAPQIVTRKSESNLNCDPVGPVKDASPLQISSGQTVAFKYEPTTTAGTVRLIIPAGVSIATAGYQQSGQYLAKGTTTELPLTEINQVQFSVAGFTIHKVLGNVRSDDVNKQCIYEVIPESVYAQALNTRDIRVSYELLEQDAAGGCTYADKLVKSNANLGKAQHTQSVRIQKAATAVSGLHQSFIAGNYNEVQVEATEIINQLQGDVNHALAVYYYVASLVMRGKKEGDFTRYSVQIHNLLRLFFERQWNEQTAADFGSVKTVGEYQKVHKYLCEVDKQFGKQYQAMCS